MDHIAAHRVALEHEPIVAEQQLANAQVATTGYTDIGTLGNCSVGIWEMSTGSMTDIEADEYFVVLSGRGTVQVLVANGFAEQTQHLLAGSLVRLRDGMQTVWHVEETLRKIYLTSADG